MTQESSPSIINVLAAIASIDVKIDNIKEDVERLTHTVIGNGQEGLVVQVDRLKQNEVHNKEVRAKSLTFRAIIIGGLLTVVGSVGGAGIVVFLG